MDLRLELSAVVVPRAPTLYLLNVGVSQLEAFQVTGVVPTINVVASPDEVTYSGRFPLRNVLWDDEELVSVLGPSDFVFRARMVDGVGVLNLKPHEFSFGERAFFPPRKSQASPTAPTPRNSSSACSCGRWSVVGGVLVVSLLG